jgi:CDP-4-dehydro-6-deoxyglucose reductase, E1
MEYKVPLVRDAFLNDAETRIRLADFILTEPRLSMGHECQKFEEEFSAWQGRKHSVLFNSGSSANLALLQACMNLGLLSQWEYGVGVSALTWATNVMPIMQLGMVPVVLDVSPATLNILPSTLEKHEGYPLTALFITNALGFCSDLRRIKDICAKRKILLLEDNCEAMGTETQAGKTGNFGLASTFSFYVAHHLCTIEGGMVCTDDDELADMLKMVRAHGWKRNLAGWVAKDFQDAYTFYDLAYNLRPTEITGFLGRVQLPLVDEAMRQRTYNYTWLAGISNSNPGFLTRELGKWPPAFAFPVVCKSAALRAKYLKRFADAGVETRPLIAGNIQRQPFYKKYAMALSDTPGADFLQECGFYVTNRPDLTEDELKIIEGCLA